MRCGLSCLHVRSKPATVKQAGCSSLDSYWSAAYALVGRGKEPSDCPWHLQNQEGPPLADPLAAALPRVRQVDASAMLLLSLAQHWRCMISCTAGAAHIGVCKQGEVYRGALK